FDPQNRRHQYPLTTCTECGPRYSIIRQLPYDRPSTSMADFPLCSACEAEYTDADCRRFHAQPVACPTCGPQVAFRDPQGVTMQSGSNAVHAAAGMLQDGRIVAVKGLGGFQLLVRADRSECVARLRARKHRPTKPFAVMVRSMEEVERLAHVSPVERQLL